jgi:hypothetical protein
MPRGVKGTGNCRKSWNLCGAHSTPSDPKPLPAPSPFKTLRLTLAVRFDIMSSYTVAEEQRDSAIDLTWMSLASSDVDLPLAGPPCRQNSRRSCPLPRRTSSSSSRRNAILVRRTATSRCFPMSGSVALTVRIRKSQPACTR